MSKAITKQHRVYWMCPYYHKDERCAVRCEGGRIELPKEAARDYILTYCADLNGWRRCTVARAITRHYERSEEDF